MGERPQAKPSWGYHVIYLILKVINLNNKVYTSFFYAHYRLSNRFMYVVTMLYINIFRSEALVPTYIQ